MRSWLFSWVLVHMRPCACPPIMEFCFPQFCGIPAIKPHWPWKLGSLAMTPPHCPTPRLGCLIWSSELSILQNFCGIIIFQPMGHPPNMYGIWFYRDYTSRRLSPRSFFFFFEGRVSLLVDSSFVLVFFCQWCFHKRWALVLLLHHLVSSLITVNLNAQFSRSEVQYQSHWAKVQVSAGLVPSRDCWNI